MTERVTRWWKWKRTICGTSRKRRTAGASCHTGEVHATNTYKFRQALGPIEAQTHRTDTELRSKNQSNL
jgi:hypothetical protein